ncbi:MAG: sigma-70 family RNA polymerase sigma factor [Phycisphaerales bacterium]|nr:sigma-70 family RNA polymerase sigma factor [Phycisphaerales bacterium]MCB9858650.1 sigma-70 family RNA polymerase sigma factor [Phycisphaerales bacterium]
MSEGTDNQQPHIDVNDATQLLARVNDGDSTAANALLPLVYAQLRAIAGSYFRGEPADQTLQPTALVHEAYLKLVKSPESDWQSRMHFCAVAATAMRQILQDRARRRRAEKRGGDAQREPLTDQLQTPANGATLDVLTLNDALEKLEKLSPRKSRIVELRFFGGLTIEQVAKVLDVSHTTIENEWRVARAWLSRELGEEPSS